MERRSKIYEEYTDACVELFMSYYAEQLFANIEADGEDTPFPEELDRKCRGLLKKAILRQRWQQCQKAAFKVLGRVAVVAMVLLSTFTVLFMSVEAIRVPVINYYLSHSKLGYSSISAAPQENPDFDREHPLKDMLPPGYTLTQKECTAENNFIALYVNEEGNSVFVSCRPSSNVTTIDTEDAVVQNFSIFNCDVVMATEGDAVTLMFGYEPWETTIVMVVSDPQIDTIGLATEFISSMGNA